VLKFGIFGEKVCQKLHQFLSRRSHAQLPGGRPSAVAIRRTMPSMRSST
jgi:hypothetical protein